MLTHINIGDRVNYHDKDINLQNVIITETRKAMHLTNNIPKGYENVVILHNDCGEEVGNIFFLPFVQNATLINKETLVKCYLCEDEYSLEDLDSDPKELFYYEPDYMCSGCRYDMIGWYQ